jgi:hypothetical protein
MHFREICPYVVLPLMPFSFRNAGGALSAPVPQPAGNMESYLPF